MHFPDLFTVSCSLPVRGNDAFALVANEVIIVMQLYKTQFEMSDGFCKTRRRLRAAWRVLDNDWCCLRALAKVIFFQTSSFEDYLGKQDSPICIAPRHIRKAFSVLQR